MLQEYCRNTAGILQEYCRNTVGMLQEYCRHAAEILDTYCGNTAEILDTYCGNTAALLQECCRETTGILQEYCRNAAGILWEYCWNALGMLQECCRNTAGILGLQWRLAYAGTLLFEWACLRNVPPMVVLCTQGGTSTFLFGSLSSIPAAFPRSSFQKKTWMFPLCCAERPSGERCPDTSIQTVPSLHRRRLHCNP